MHAGKHQSFYKLALSFLIEVSKYVQSTKNKKLVMFLKKNIKKTAFVFYCDAERSYILRGSSHVRCYLLLKEQQLFNEGTSSLTHNAPKNSHDSFVRC